MSETVDLSIELEAVKAQLALYRDAVESMHQGVCMYDAEGRITLVNRRYAEQLRLPPESVLAGLTASEVLQLCIDAGHYPGQTLEEVRARIKGKIAPGSTLGTMVRGDRTYATRRCPARGGNLLTTCEDITAEGIESEDQARRLLELACDFGQGFLFAKAVPASRVPSLVERWSAPLAAYALHDRPLRLVANRD